jgi:hypothetical protein
MQMYNRIFLPATKFVKPVTIALAASLSTASSIVRTLLQTVDDFSDLPTDDVDDYYADSDTNQMTGVDAGILAGTLVGAILILTCCKVIHSQCRTNTNETEYVRMRP